MRVKCCGAVALRDQWCDQAVSGQCSIGRLAQRGV